MKLYTLRKNTNNLRITEFQNGIIGQNIQILSEIPSTNDYLKEILSNSEPFPEGSVILAVHQTQGRGQIKASWQSSPGENLTLSFPLYPKFLPIIQQFRLNIALSLAVHATVKEILPNHDVCIKWPNDILVDNKKISGILIENFLQGKTWKSVVIGIGLNVNQQDFPIQGNFHATSLSKVSSTSFDLNKVFHILCSHLNARYSDLQNANKFLDMKKCYLENLFGYETDKEILVDGIIKMGKVKDVNEWGEIRIEFPENERNFRIKEIQFQP